MNLKPSYLSGLSIGDHTLEASFKDYEEKVKAVFTIKAKEEKHEDEEAAVPAYRIPATGIHD